MGATFSSFINYFTFTKTENRVLMVGLDGAGKTTILYKLKLDEVITTKPTIGFHVETIEHKNLRLTIWEISGQTLMWHFYYKNTDAVIFVVDSVKAENLLDAAEALENAMQSVELENVVLLVLANKQDKPGALNAAEIIEKLKLNKLKQPWHLEVVSAIEGTGLWTSLDHLSTMLNKHKK